MKTIVLKKDEKAATYRCGVIIVHPMRAPKYIECKGEVKIVYPKIEYRMFI